MSFALVLVYLILFGGISAAGIYVLGVAVDNVVLGINSKSWPTTDGTITSACIDSQPGSPGCGEFPGEAESHQAKIKYQYQVNGVFYESKRLRFGFNDFDIFFSLRAAQGQISEYFGGKTIKVYYHPQKPQVATLQPGLKLASVLFCLLGSIILMFGLGALMFSLRSLT